MEVDEGSGSWGHGTSGVVWEALDIGRRNKVQMALISKFGWGFFLEGTGGKSNNE